MSRPFSSADAFSAIAHPLRRRILELLSKREQSPGEMAQQLRVSAPALSGHLRILREAGLVEGRNEGMRTMYRMVPKKFADMIAWVDRLRS